MFWYEIILMIISLDKKMIRIVIILFKKRLDFLKSKGVFPINKVFILVKYHCNLYSLDDENYYEDDNDFIDEVFDLKK